MPPDRFQSLLNERRGPLSGKKKSSRHNTKSGRDEQMTISNATFNHNRRFSAAISLLLSPRLCSASWCVLFFCLFGWLVCCTSVTIRVAVEHATAALEVPRRRSEEGAPTSKLPSLFEAGDRLFTLPLSHPRPPRPPRRWLSMFSIRSRQDETDGDETDFLLLLS